MKYKPGLFFLKFTAKLSCTAEDNFMVYIVCIIDELINNPFIVQYVRKGFDVCALSIWFSIIYELTFSSYLRANASLLQVSR